MTIAGPVKKVVVHLEFEDKNNNGELDVSGYVEGTTVVGTRRLPIPVQDTYIFAAGKKVAELVEHNALPLLVGLPSKLPFPKLPG